MPELRYCPECGEPLQRHVVAGEERNHWCCTAAGSSTTTPMVVVTCFVANDDKLLWVQRGIEPSAAPGRSPVALPGAGETLAEACSRELHEEAGVLLPADQLQLYMTGTITFINQVYVAFRATGGYRLLPGRWNRWIAFLFSRGVPLGGSRLPRGQRLN